ncbi:MAG: hypothetical protein WCW26_03740, partial [Candidatus Buchananbacteria bacterium]
NFENILSQSLKPYGWNLEYPLLTEAYDKNFSKLRWVLDYAKLIDNPNAAQKEGLSPVSPEGSKFVKINGPYVISSGEIDVFGGKDYVISAYVNTKNLSKGAAAIRIREYKADGGRIDSIPTELPEPLLTVPIGNDWVLRQVNFKTNSQTARIKILLSNWNPITIGGSYKTRANPWTTDKLGIDHYSSDDIIHEVIGSSYFDDIIIKPNLQVTNSAYVPPSCRIYPSADALSCDYYTSDNMRLRGWLGYCTEVDPANPAQCLLWWPVELIEGGFVDELPVITQAPLYYCLKAKENYYSFLDCLFNSGNNQCASAGIYNGARVADRVFNWKVPAGWNIEKWQIDKIRMTASESVGCDPTEACTTAPTRAVLTENINDPGSDTYLNIQRGWSGKLNFGANNQLESVDFTVSGTNCICSNADITFEVKKQWCQYLVQVVTPFGQSKPWWSRVSDASGHSYIIKNLNYTYAFDYPPFGSMVPPSPVETPSNWNTAARNDLYIRPVWVGSADKVNFTDPFQVRAGIPYSCDQTSINYSSRRCSYPNSKNQSSVNKIANTTVGGQPAEAQGLLSLQNIFARNYGTWEFQGDGVCKTSTTGEVALDEDGNIITCACPQSACAEANTTLKFCGSPSGVASIKGVCSNCTQNCEFCTNNEDCGGADGVFCDFSRGICSGGSNAKEPCGQNWHCYDAAGVDQGECSQELCPDGVSCPATGICSDGTACNSLSCPTGQACKASTDECVGGTCERPNESESLTLFGTEDSSGQICEVGFFACPIDFTELLYVAGTGIMELTVGGLGWEGVLITTLLDLGSQLIGNCRPKACGTNSDCSGGESGEGYCINFLHYILYHYGLAEEQDTFLENITGPIFNNLGNIYQPGGDDEGGIEGIIGRVIGTFSNEGTATIIERFVEGAADVMGGDASVIVFAALRSNLLNNYCSRTNFTCNKTAKPCCPLWSPVCGGVASVAGRCESGPNKYLSCVPKTMAQEIDPDSNGDECPDGYGCFFRSNNESYRSVENYRWTEPENLCSNLTNQRVKNYKCSGDCTDPDGICECTNDSDCTSGECLLIADDNYCAVAPKISSIYINNKTGTELIIYGGDYVKLVFTTEIDDQQLPLNGYIVNWGDGTTDSVSGQALRSHPDKVDPFTVSHLYSFWDLQQAESQGKLECPNNPVDSTPGKCCNSQECHVVPKIQVRDNWNWCNGNLRCDGNANGNPCSKDGECGVGQCLPVGGKWGYHGNDCSSQENAWQYFNGTIVVYPYFSQYK